MAIDQIEAKKRRIAQPIRSRTLDPLLQDVRRLRAEADGLVESVGRHA